MTTTTTTTDPTKFEYNTDVKQLLNLIVNTFYSTKEVFLRELISNASDSLTKLRHASLTNPQALVDTKELTIEIVPDKTRNTLTIRDTGTGMSEEELISNLGTLAHSTTKNYLVSDADGNPLHNLIGQYGVGFYSAFLVSDKVVVRSKNPGVLKQFGNRLLKPIHLRLKRILILSFPVELKSCVSSETNIKNIWTKLVSAILSSTIVNLPISLFGCGFGRKKIRSRPTANSRTTTKRLK